MKKLCDENMVIKGPFSLPMLHDYFMSKYILGRRLIPLTEVYDSVIFKEFPYQEESLKMLILKEMQMPFVKYPRKDVITYIDKFVAQYGMNGRIREMMEMWNMMWKFLPIYFWNHITVKKRVLRNFGKHLKDRLYMLIFGRVGVLRAGLRCPKVKGFMRSSKIKMLFSFIWH